MLNEIKSLLYSFESKYLNSSLKIVRPVGVFRACLTYHWTCWGRKEGGRREEGGRKEGEGKAEAEGEGAYEAFNQSPPTPLSQSSPIFSTQDSILWFFFCFVLFVNKIRIRNSQCFDNFLMIYNPNIKTGSAFVPSSYISLSKQSLKYSIRTTTR